MGAREMLVIEYLLGFVAREIKASILFGGLVENIENFVLYIVMMVVDQVEYPQSDESRQT